MTLWETLRDLNLRERLKNKDGLIYEKDNRLLTYLEHHEQEHRRMIGELDRLQIAIINHFVRENSGKPTDSE